MPAFMSQDSATQFLATDSSSPASDALSRLGFQPDEQWQCRTLRGGQFVLPAEVAGRPARLILDTGMHQDLFLYRAFAEACELRIGPGEGGFEWAANVNLTCLGAKRAYKWVYVVSPDLQSRLLPPIAGAIGPCFLDASVLAFNAATPAVARSAAVTPQLARTDALCRLLLSGVLANGQWVTAGLFSDVASTPPKLMIDTGYAQSMLSTAFIDRFVPKRLASRIRAAARSRGWADIPFDLASGRRAKQRMHLIDPGKQDAEDPRALHECDGTLGMDFFRRWVSLFDPSGRQVLVYPY